MSTEQSKVEEVQKTNITEVSGKKEVTEDIETENINLEETRSEVRSKSDEKLMVCFGEIIGSGSFGELRRARTSDSDEEMAAKLEETTVSDPKLRHEYDIYRILGKTKGIPTIFLYGLCGERGEYNCLLMELLGNSLNYFHKKCNRKFSVKMTAQIALQMLDRIEFLHSKGVVYRDVKPENFLFGRVDTKTLYIIDFGLSKLYIDPKTKKHISYSENRNEVGTPRFMSLNTHCGREQSRRDDIESIGYLLMYFLRGSLPWQNLPANSNDKCEMIGIRKQETPVLELCYGFPVEFATILNYSRTLKFNEKLDYEYLRSLFRTVLEKNDFQADDVYDWDEE